MLYLSASTWGNRQFIKTSRDPDIASKYIRQTNECGNDRCPTKWSAICATPVVYNYSKMLTVLLDSSSVRRPILRITEAFNAASVNICIKVLQTRYRKIWPTSKTAA